MQIVNLQDNTRLCHYVILFVKLRLLVEISLRDRRRMGGKRKKKQRAKSVSVREGDACKDAIDFFDSFPPPN